MERWISSLRASHSRANHSAQPGSSSEKQTSDGYGTTLQGAFATWDRDGSFTWRTYQGSLFTDSTRYSDRWPNSGSMRSGTCSARQESERRTSAAGSSYSRGEWPTPRTISGGAESAERKQELGRTASGGGDLQAAAKAWPTPTAGDSQASGSRNVAGSKAHAGMSLTDLVTTGDSHGRAWATPGANDFKGSSQPGQRRGQLDEQVSHRFHLDPPTPTPGEQSSSDGPNSHRQWPTPNAISGHQSGTMGETGGSGNPFRGTPLKTAKLNPNFVDWLMGWPPGWTACEPLGTASFRSWQRVHSSLLRDVLG